jgi:hypothetical protein
MFFIRSLPRTENLSPTSPRLCDECYPKMARADGRAEQSPAAH